MAKPRPVGAASSPVTPAEPPPRISVVIPVYNNARNAKRAVISVLRQTVPVHEIVLVDDASQDADFARLTRFAGTCRSAVPVRIERLRENVGAGLARHRGANLAEGTHVAFLDADDVWHWRKIEAVARAITDERAELIGHARPWNFSIPGSTLRDSVDSRNRRFGRLRFLALNPIPTSSIVTTLQIARRMFRFGGRRAEDYMALVVASRLARCTVFIDAPLGWALKPPFGYAGEGANQVSIYRASATAMLTLYRARIIGALELAIFFAFLAARVPIGLVRQFVYRWRYRKE